MKKIFTIFPILYLVVFVATAIGGHYIQNCSMVGGDTAGSSASLLCQPSATYGIPAFFRKTTKIDSEFQPNLKNQFYPAGLLVNVVFVFLVSGLLSTVVYFVRDRLLRGSRQAFAYALATFCIVWAASIFIPGGFTTSNCPTYKGVTYAQNDCHDTTHFGIPTFVSRYDYPANPQANIDAQTWWPFNGWKFIENILLAMSVSGILIAVFRPRQKIPQDTARIPSPQNGNPKI